MHTSIEGLLARVTVVESDVNSLKQTTPSASSENNLASSLTRDIAQLKGQLDVANNRTRRNNLIIHGITDIVNENWADSEEKARSFFQTQLGECVSPDRIERAHRIGQFCESKNRPIIVMFSSYKDKERILSCGPKLKETDFAMRNDLTPAVRLAHSKLLQHARTLDLPYKLRHDRLVINKKNIRLRFWARPSSRNKKLAKRDAVVSATWCMRS